MKDVLVVMALEMESDGRFADAGIPVLYTGVGKVNAAHALTRKLAQLRSQGRSLPLVVNFGTAGSRRWPTHSLVACERFVQRDMDVRGLGFALGETPFETVPVALEFEKVFEGLPSAICGSGDVFEMARDDARCDVVDMEAYALAKVCHLEGANFACAKFVSDGADESASTDWKSHVSLAAKAFVTLYEALTSGASTVQPNHQVGDIAIRDIARDLSKLL